jgi:hypothetical protein
MNKTQIFIASVLALPTWGFAQPASDIRSDPAEPQTRVPATQYRSVFKDTPMGLEREQQDWKKANAEVGQFLRGHLDLLKLEEQNPKPPMPEGPSPVVPTAKPAAAAAHKH